MIKTSADVERALNAMPAQQREEVQEIIRRHIAACYRLGFRPESLDRVYAEAIEIVKLGDNQEPVKQTRDWEPRRRYTQYASPKADSF